MITTPAFIGLPNHASQAYASIITSSFGGLIPAGFEVSLLQNEEPTERARWTLLDPFHTQFALGTSGIACRYDGMALVNHNIADGGQVRFIGKLTGQTLIQPHRVAPGGITATFNITGAVGDIDEAIDILDGNNISPTSTSAQWGFRAEFPTPAGTIGGHSDSLCFVVRVRRAYSGAGASSPTTYPAISINLTEGGSLIRFLGQRAVTADIAGGQILIFPFSLSELADSSGAGIGAEIAGESGVSPSGHSYVVVEAVSLYWEDPMTGDEDSGWITIDNGDDRPAPLQPTKDVSYIPPIAWQNVTGVTVLMRTDQTRHDPPTAPGVGGIPVGVIKAPDSFAQAGVFCAGEGIVLGRGIRHGVGPMAGPETVGFDGASAAGQPYGSDAFRFRSTESIEVMVSRDEAHFLQDQMAFRRARHGAFYVVLEPGVEPKYQLFSSFWGTLKSISRPRPLGRYRADGQMLFSMDLQFAERL